MSNTKRLALFVIGLSLLALTAAVPTRGEKPPASAPTAAPSARFEKEIEAFEAADRKAPPPPGAVLFVGDSAIRLWKTLPQDFPDEKVINRGFGGSQLADSVYYADRIVIPYKPRLIVLKAGGNDLTAGKTPEQILADFQAFVEKVRAGLPDVRICYMGSSPNPSRWSQAEKRKKTNALIKAYIDAGKNLDFVLVWNEFLDADGKPREDLFVNDRLHNNAEGYKILAQAVRPHLRPRTNNVFNIVAPGQGPNQLFLQTPRRRGYAALMKVIVTQTVPPRRPGYSAALQ